MIDAEVQANAAAFRAGLLPSITTNLAATEGTSAAKFDEAYARLTSLQAWRSFVLEQRLPPAVLGFFTEAQNDGLTSLVQVAAGLWRPSLKSLRSLIENVIHCFYYKDHPVEYILWENGTHRPQFKVLFDYFERHPSISGLSEKLSPTADLRKHYADLSNAVHSSAKELRMTNNSLVANLWKVDAASVGKWNSRHKEVLRDVNLLALALFAEYAQAAAAKGLREALSAAIPSGKDAAIKAELGVRLIR